MVEEEKQGNPTAFIQYLREEQDRIDLGVTVLGDVGSEAEPLEELTSEQLHKVLNGAHEIEVFNANLAVLSMFPDLKEAVEKKRKEFFEKYKPRNS